MLTRFLGGPIFCSDRVLSSYSECVSLYDGDVLWALAGLMDCTTNRSQSKKTVQELC